MRWVPAALLTLSAAAMVAFERPEASTVVVAVVFLVLAVLLSPLLFPRSTSEATARQRAEETGVPLIYWRPGCVYCTRLRLALGRLGRRAVWVDVSCDADAAARVRAHNNGDETVPTVFVGDAARTNPPPGWVRERIRDSSAV